MKPNFTRIAAPEAPPIRSTRECYALLDACVTEEQFMAVRPRVATWILKTWRLPRDREWAETVAYGLWVKPLYRTPPNPWSE